MRAPDFWTKTDTGSRALVTALTPLGWLYGASVEWKAAHAHPFRAQAKVICVGNLTVGGTGKTPVAVAIADILAARGRKVCFLSRGYGGRTKGPLRVSASAAATEVGDEPLLLARQAPVIVAHDRSEGAKLADADGIDTIVMDDGHQNFSLKKDLSFVVVDQANGFGNGRVLPAGPLREPVAQGLRRADAVIIVGDGKAPIPDLPIPVLRARLITPEIPELKGIRVAAFAGIGNPEKFFAALPRLGVEIADTRAFDDHHVYTQSEVARLKAKAKSLGAQLVTTEKDYVRLTQTEREGITAIPVRAVFDDPAALSRLLDRL